MSHADSSVPHGTQPLQSKVPKRGRNRNTPGNHTGRSNHVHKGQGPDPDRTLLLSTELTTYARSLAHARKLHPSPPSSDAAEAAGSSPSHSTCLQHNDSLSLHTLHRTLKDQDMLPSGKGTNAMVPFHEGRKDDTWGMETGRHTRGRHSCNSFIKF